MGDRFYMQQKGIRGMAKPKRRLKKDILAVINTLLNTEIKGLDKCTIATLDELTEAITALIKEAENEQARST